MVRSLHRAWSRCRAGASSGRTRRKAISTQLLGAHTAATAHKAALEFIANGAMDPFGVDPGATCGVEAMDAEA
jgi:hypothetical protein